VDITKFFHDDVGGAAVKVAGGFIGEDETRIGDERASDGNALLLAAAELPGHVIFAFLEVEMVEDVAGHAQAAVFVKTGVNEGEGDVFDDGKGGDEVKVLENEADLAGAEFGLAAAANAGDVAVAEEVLSRGGLVDEADNVQEGGFTAARRPHDHNEFAAFNGEVEIAQGIIFGIAETIAFGQALKLDDSLLICHCLLV